jgi:hypothetical protein
VRQRGGRSSREPAHGVSLHGSTSTDSSPAVRRGDVREILLHPGKRIWCLFLDFELSFFLLQSFAFSLFLREV